MRNGFSNKFSNMPNLYFEGHDYSKNVTDLNVNLEYLFCQILKQSASRSIRLNSDGLFTCSYEKLLRTIPEFSKIFCFFFGKFKFIFVTEGISEVEQLIAKKICIEIVQNYFSSSKNLDIEIQTAFDLLPFNNDFFPRRQNIVCSYFEVILRKSTHSFIIALSLKELNEILFGLNIVTTKKAE